MISFRKTKYLFAAAALFALGAGFISAKNSDFEKGKNLDVLFNLFREVQADYVDETDPEELVKNAAQGMLRGLDPYTNFLPREDMSEFEILTTGKYGGIGAVIRQKGEWVEIAQPYRGFAADKAGLKIGDRILEIDGQSMKNATTESVSSRMKGDPGTTFTLKIQRVTDGTAAELEIRRERIEMSGVAYRGMLDATTGYIAHSDFTEGVSKDIREAIVELKKQGMTSLVYDLRGNGGGLMQEAVEIVGLFVPRGSEVVEIRGRGDRKAAYRTDANPLDAEMPLVVLIDRGSASASEIVAGALQDYDRAVIVGRRSFGKGLVQSTRPLGFDNYVKITTARYYIPSGRCIQAIDYSRRAADGSAAAVPDSLIRRFTTRNGREVFDGGGIQPDVPAEEPAYSLFTTELYNRGYIEDFAREWQRGQNFQPVNVDFHLSDADYAAFTEFMSAREVEYESETRLALQRLVDAAQKEQYDERIAPEVAALTEKLDAQKGDELTRLHPEIARLIEDEIVLWYHYADGVIRHNLPGDPVVGAARGVLADASEYRGILDGD